LAWGCTQPNTQPNTVDHIHSQTLLITGEDQFLKKKKKKKREKSKEHITFYNE